MPPQEVLTHVLRAQTGLIAGRWGRWLVRGKWGLTGKKRGFMNIAGVC